MGIKGNFPATYEHIANIDSFALFSKYTLTTSYVGYSLSSGKKLSDYDMLVFSYIDNSSWYIASVFIQTAEFISAAPSAGIALFANGIEVDCKYLTDTTIEAKYVGTTTRDVGIKIYGLRKKQSA